MANTIVITKFLNGNVLVNNNNKEYISSSSYLPHKDVANSKVNLLDADGSVKDSFRLEDVEKVIHSDTTEVNINDLDTLFTELITFFFFKLDSSTSPGSTQSFVFEQTLNAGSQDIIHNLSKKVTDINVFDGDDYAPVDWNRVDNDKINIDLAAGQIVDAEIVITYIV